MKKWHLVAVVHSQVKWLRPAVGQSQVKWHLLAVVHSQVDHVVQPVHGVLLPGHLPDFVLYLVLLPLHRPVLCLHGVLQPLHRPDNLCLRLHYLLEGNRGFQHLLEQDRYF